MSDPIIEFNADGSKVRHPLEGLVEHRRAVIYKDPKTNRLYNELGEVSDDHGRLWKPRGQKGTHSSKGKRSPNWNPGGRCHNPPHVHHRFGEFSKDDKDDGGTSSSSGYPAAVASNQSAASSQLAAAPSQPAAAPRRSQIVRTQSTGPPPSHHYSRANREDWRQRSDGNQGSSTGSSWGRSWGSSGAPSGRGRRDNVSQALIENRGSGGARR